MDKTAAQLLTTGSTAPIVNKIRIHLSPKDSCSKDRGHLSSRTVPIAEFSGANDESLLAALGGYLVPNAYAQDTGNLYYACASVVGSNVNIAVAGLGGEVAPPSQTLKIRRGTLDANGALGSISANLGETSPCESTDTRPAWISEVTDEHVTLNIVTYCFEEGGGNECNVPARVIVIPRSGDCAAPPTVYPGPCEEE